MAPHFSKHADDGIPSPVIPLVIEYGSMEKEDKTRYIQLEIKTLVNKNFPSVYKKNIKRFEEGSPFEFIQLIQDLREVFTQNKTDAAASRDAVIQNLLRGESLDTYRVSVEDLQEDESDSDKEFPLDKEMIKKAMQELAKTVFPFRALDKQKSWMERDMKKPRDLKVRKLSAAITRLNNELEFYPEGTEESKFDKKKLVQLIEWALPASWKYEFEKKGYIPSQHNKARLIQEAEIIERQIEARGTERSEKKREKKKRPWEKEKSDDKRHPSKGRRSQKNESSKKRKPKGFNCSNCGPNNTHNDAKCYHLHPDVRPKWTKKKPHEMNMIEEPETESEIAKLKRIVNSLTKRLKTSNVKMTSEEAIPRKPKFNKKNDEESEEKAYQKKTCFSSDSESDDSSSSSDESE